MKRKQVNFEVLTQRGNVSVSCELMEDSVVIDQVVCRRQRTAVEIDGQSVGGYARLRLGRSNWLPWADASFTHRAKSLRDVAIFWAS